MWWGDRTPKWSKYTPSEALASTLRRIVASLVVNLGGGVVGAKWVFLGQGEVMFGILLLDFITGPGLISALCLRLVSLSSWFCFLY